MNILFAIITFILATSISMLCGILVGVFLLKVEQKKYKRG